jgi:hypothetical protein
MSCVDELVEEDIYAGSVVRRHPEPAQFHRVGHF